MPHTPDQDEIGNKEAAAEFLEEVERQFPDEEEYITLVKKWRVSIFSAPTERYAFISGQLEKDPDNAELIIARFELAVELELRDDVYELADRVLQLEPSCRTYRLIGKMKLDDGEIEKAFGLRM